MRDQILTMLTSECATQSAGNYFVGGVVETAEHDGVVGAVTHRGARYLKGFKFKPKVWYIR